MTPPPFALMIQPAQAADAPLLSALAMRSKAHWGYGEAFLTACEPFLRITPEMIGEHVVRVAGWGGAPAGFYHLERVGEDTGLLDHLYVAPEAMGRGVGAALTAHAVAKGRAMGLSRLVLDADPHAAAFYEACGFAANGQVPSDIDPTRPLPRYERALSNHAAPHHVGTRQDQAAPRFGL